MKKETYESMIATIKEQPLLAKSIPLCNNLITKAIYIAYLSFDLLIIFQSKFRLCHTVFLF